MRICTLVFPVRDGRIWLAEKKHKIGKGLMNGWGGKLEVEDEGDIVRAAIREFEEETGGARVLPGTLEKVAVIDFYEAGAHKFECHIYFCSEWTGDISETDQMGPPKDLPFRLLRYEKMMPGDKIWLGLLLAGKRFRGSCFYSEGNTHCERLEFTPRQA